MEVAHPIILNSKKNGCYLSGWPRKCFQVVNTDYINASLLVLTVGAVDRSYILTQGPLQVTIDSRMIRRSRGSSPLRGHFQATTGHFWSMVWQRQSRAVIMLTRSVIDAGDLSFAYLINIQGDREGDPQVPSILACISG